MLGVVAVIVVWALAAGVSLAVAGSRARSGLDAMEGLSGVASQDLSTLVGSVGGTSDDVEEEEVEPQLRQAADDFGGAGDLIRSAVVRPLWFAPVIGRQLRSASALSTSATTTAAAAADAVSELDEVLAGSTASGASRVDAVRRGEQVLTQLDERIDDPDLGPGERLLPPLANARNRFAREHQRVTEELDSTIEALAGVADFLEGPTRYLLLAANNGEMRAGSGMILQVGPLDVVDGTFSTEDFTATEELVLDQSATALDPDIEARWGALVPAREWRNTNLSPRFDETATTAAAMWEASGGDPVDGVISVDVVAIEALLEVTGPVTLPSGETISADTVLQDLLVDQYADFADDRDARRDRLGAVASAVFAALNERPVSAQDLVRVLRDMGAGRHVLIWSSDPVQAAAWRALGADGVPGEDTLLLSVMNRGGNKLDSYLAVASDVTVEPAGDLWRVGVEVSLENTAPTGLPAYVAGPHPFTDLAEGEYKGIVALTLPSGAGNVEIDGGVPAALGDDGPTRVAATEVRLPRGTATSVRFQFDLPTSWESVQVLSSGRVVPTQWSSGAEIWTDDVPRELLLDRPG